MPTAIFGDALELEVSCSSHAHDERFLEVIGVTDVRHVFYSTIPAERMEELAALLSSHLVRGGVLRDVIWAFVFAHGDVCTDDSVELGSTHAVSVFSREAEGMAHRYFERAGDDFREVHELAVTVSAMPNLDQIRLLHFGAFPFGELSSRSTIYEFKAKVWDVEDSLGSSNHALRTALLLDASKVAGAPAIGLHGDEVYTALRARNGTGATHCGNDGACPEGSTDCVPVPPRDSAGYTCAEDDGGDSWISVFTQAVQAGRVALDDVDFPAAREFVTDFLPRTQRGRQLMAYYYAASPRVRRDDAAMQTYVRALPALRAWLRGVLHGSDDAILATEEIGEVIGHLVALHQDVQMPEPRSVASVVRHVDWRRLRTRADVVRALADDRSEPPSGGHSYS